MHLPAGASGAGLRQGMVGLGERLWVGEPGRLSLDDREWWRPEEKLRLVCSTDDCFEIFLKSDFRLWVRTPGAPGFLLSVSSLGPLLPAILRPADTRPPSTFSGRSPVLRLPPAAPLAPACHAALGHVLPGGTHFDGSVLQGCGPEGDLVTALQE